MALLRNILAIISVIAIFGGLYAYSKVANELSALNELDSGAKKVYMNMWAKFKETGNSADATV